MRGKTRVLDLDLRSYFDQVRQDILLDKVAKRVRDDDVLRLLKMILKSSGKRGVPQGGPLSPLLANVYLNEVDKMLERAKKVTQRGEWTYVQYARFADDLVVLMDGHPRQRWLRKAVERRIREEIAKLDVQVNEEKTRKVDLARGDSFCFMGFQIRRIQSRAGKWMPLRIPKIQKRTELLRKLKVIFRRFVSQPVQRVIRRINPILRGWVNYFAKGH